MNPRSVLATLAILLAISGTSLADETYSTGPYASELDYLQERSGNLVQVPKEDAIGLIRAVQLVVNDEADGCWTQDSQIEDMATDRLNDAGIEVFSEPMETYDAFSPRVTIAVTGYRSSAGVCVGYASLDVKVASADDLGSLTYTKNVFRVLSVGELWRKAALFSGDSLNDTVQSQVHNWLDLFVDDYADARHSDVVSQLVAVWGEEMPATAQEAATADMVAGFAEVWKKHYGSE